MFKDDKSKNLKKIKQQEKYFIQPKKHNKTFFQHLTEKARFLLFISSVNIIYCIYMPHIYN